MPISEFRVRWKGRESGPYPLAELKRRLARGELSTLHRAEYQGQWVPVDRLIAMIEGGPDARHDAPNANAVDSESTQVKTAYFYCGLSFLLPGIGTLAAVMTMRRVSPRALRTELALLAGALTLAGIAFWFTALNLLKLI